LSGSGLTIQNPTQITNNNLVFLISYTAGTINETKTITVSGIGADLVYEVSLLTVSVGDAVSNGTVSPALATFTNPGNTDLDVDVSPISTHYIDPGYISANVSSLGSYNSSAISGTVTKDVIIRNYTGNKIVIDDIKQPVIAMTIGKTYIFDQSDSSNASHPLKFSTTSDGTHGGGSEYTTGVTENGTPGTAGAYIQIEITESTPDLYYYCSNHSGMGGATNIVPFNISVTSSSLTAGFPITVPNVATNNSLGISGSALAKPTLTWATPASGVITTPSGTTVGVAYTITPYDSPDTRTATIRWTASGSTKVFLPDGHDITYDVPGYSVTSTVESSTQEYLEKTIVLPKVSETTLATSTITGAGEVTASVGTYVPSITFAADSNPSTLITNANGATIPIQISSNQNWVLTNGSPGSKVVDPDGLDLLGSNYPFAINVSDNTTGSSRTATLTISKYNNTRVTGPAIADQTITITQNA